jgi:hypothetical protein
MLSGNREPGGQAVALRSPHVFFSKAGGGSTLPLRLRPWRGFLER